MKKQKRELNYGDEISLLFPELFSSDSKRQIVKSVTFQVTDACNLACTYCYQINKNTRRMSFETAKKFIDNLLSGDKGFKDYVSPEESPAIILEFIGGEPFLEVDLIEQICNYFEKRVLELDHPWAQYHMYSICSNGTLYKTPKVQHFLQKHLYDLSFTVTIDGNKELHDSCRIFPDGSPSYDLAFGAAQDWINRGHQMGSKITIAPANLDYVEDAIDNLVESGYDSIHANCVYEEGWNLDHATKFYYTLKTLADKLLTQYPDGVYLSLFDEDGFRPMAEDDNQNWCGGTGVMLACDPDGFLYPCIRYMESSLGTDVEPLRIGHVDTGIGQCCKEKKCIQDLNAITRRSQSTDECWNCPIAQGCSWCSGYNYQCFGTPNKRATFICPMHKARALANAYYWNMYYRKHNLSKRKIVYCPKDWALEIIPEEEYNYLLTLSQNEQE